MFRKDKCSVPCSGKNILFCNLICFCLINMCLSCALEINCPCCAFRFKKWALLQLSNNCDHFQFKSTCEDLVRIYTRQTVKNYNFNNKYNFLLEEYTVKVVVIFFGIFFYMTEKYNMFYKN